MTADTETIREALELVCDCGTAVYDGPIRQAAALAALGRVEEREAELAEKVAAAEHAYEGLRQLVIKRPPDTEARDTYADGYTDGLIEAMHFVNSTAIATPVEEVQGIFRRASAAE